MNFSLRDSKNNLLFHEAIPSKSMETISPNYFHTTRFP